MRPRNVLISVGCLRAQLSTALALLRKQIWVSGRRAATDDIPGAILCSVYSLRDEFNFEATAQPPALMMELQHRTTFKYVGEYIILSEAQYRCFAFFFINKGEPYTAAAD